MAWRIDQRVVCVAEPVPNSERDRHLIQTRRLDLPRLGLDYTIAELRSAPYLPSGLGFRLAELPYLLTCSSAFRPAVDGEMERLRALLAPAPAPEPAGLLARARARLARIAADFL